MSTASGTPPCRRMSAGLASSGARALQIVYAGKGHPAHQASKEVIHRVIGCARTLRPAIKAVYLEAYDMARGAIVTAGVDVWLNTPEPSSSCVSSSCLLWVGIQ